MSAARQKFYKYHGCGNDFVVVDLMGWPHASPLPAWMNTQGIQALCAWHTGIGADGLIALRPSERHSFRMDYYNADGNPGSLCGNGSRCAVRCADDLGYLSGPTDGVIHFEAHDGIHSAQREGEQVEVSLHDFAWPETCLQGWYVNNGSPHLLMRVEDTQQVGVAEEGRLLRHHPQFAPGGTNVNFVQVLGDNRLRIRTFERGVERETLACGTGVTAAAAWYAVHAHPHSPAQGRHTIGVQTLGGELQVRFVIEGQYLREVRLKGPASFVFEGVFPVDSNE
jgi:diaminopimelate epimerase